MSVQECYIHLKFYTDMGSSAENDFVKFLLTRLKKIIKEVLLCEESDFENIRTKLNELANIVDTFISEEAVTDKIKIKLGQLSVALRSQTVNLQSNNQVSFPEDRYFSNFKNDSRLKILTLCQNSVSGLTTHLPGFCEGFVIYFFVRYISKNRNIQESFFISNDDNFYKRVIPNIKITKLQYVRVFPSNPQLYKINSYFRIVQADILATTSIESFSKRITTYILNDGHVQSYYLISANASRFSSLWQGGHSLGILKQGARIYFIEANAFIAEILDPIRNLSDFFVGYIDKMNSRLRDLRQPIYQSFELRNVGVDLAPGTRRSFSDGALIKIVLDVVKQNTFNLLLSAISVFFFLFTALKGSTHTSLMYVSLLFLIIAAYRISLSNKTQKTESMIFDLTTIEKNNLKVEYQNPKHDDKNPLCSLFFKSTPSYKKTDDQRTFHRNMHVPLYQA